MATRVTVHGRVQGVFFRASTRDLARRVGVAGWVRNDPDGGVTAHLEGDAGAVAQVVAWCRAGGPDRARVERVSVTEVAEEGHTGFFVRH
jgi:acylphosphatase